MATFSGMINCTQCNKKFNFKNNNGTHVYVCQTKKNYGKKKCNSTTVKEEFLIDLLKHHCQYYKKDFNLSKVHLYIREINIKKDEITILFWDGNKSFASENHLKLV